MTDGTPTWEDGTARSARRSRPPTAGAPAFELRVLEGPDAGLVYGVDAAAGTTLFVGRSPLCALRLSDSGAAPRHCAIELREDRLRFVDLSPEKSTRVNGVLAHEAFLTGGEVVRIGGTAIAVRRVETTPWLAGAEVRSFGRVLGESPEMLALYPLFAILAESRGLLVIEGERGTGKRLLAEELHVRGPQNTRPFVVVSRHESISVAERVQAARGGTLYVEEGALLAPEALLELARAPDVRVVVGTRDASGLPPDLGERVVLPALRDREGDVETLARSFWGTLGGEGALPDDFVARYEDHEWPGNVRELRVAVQDRLRHGTKPVVSDIREIVVARTAEKASVTTDAIDRILEHDLPFTQAREAMLAEFERRYVGRALERAANNVARAAANSGIAHRYFQVLKSRRKSA